MVKLRDMIPVMHEFLLGDYETHKILPPDIVACDWVINARVMSVSVQDNTNVIWISPNPHGEV